MNLYIHLPTRLEIFDILLDWYLLSTTNDRDIASFFMTNFKWEIASSISPQYEANFSSIREMKKKFWKDVFGKIDGIYYGSDNCEYLVPTLAEIKKAYEKFGEFNKKFPPHKVRTFVLVTPYVWDEMLARLDEVLEYLNNIKSKTPLEVVFNDYGTLSLLTKKYTNLKPVMWRIIHKTLKTPLVDTYGYEAHPAGESIKNKTSQEIEQIREKIVSNQKDFYSSSELSNTFLQKFLSKYTIKNVWIDYLENREKLYDKNNYNWFSLDIYYPWATVFTGRLCDTCAVESPDRWMYATDWVCPRWCKTYDIFYDIKTSGYNLIQRWNAWYKSQINLDYLDLSNINDDYRFIFAPFVTV